MLPSGHLAGGYLTAKALLHFTHPAVTSAQYNQLVLWGVFFGFAPDLDIFYLFLKSGSFKADPDKGDHRKYYGHAPVLWLIAGLVVYLLATNPFWQTFGLLIWLGSWSHFLLDSVQYGIMWFWPLDKTVHALVPVNNQALYAKMHEAIKKPFFSYWLTFVKEYSKYFWISLTCESILVISSLIIYFTHR